MNTLNIKLVIGDIKRNLAIFAIRKVKSILKWLYRYENSLFRKYQMPYIIQEDEYTLDDW